MKNSPKNSSNKSRIVIAIIAIVAIACMAFVAYFTMRSDSSESSANKERNSVNYSGPTTEEQQAGDEQKDKIITEEQNQTTPETASIIISNTGQSGEVVRVRAFVSNAVESGGTCTTKLSKDGSTVIKETPAFADASSTQCGAIDFDRNQFTSGGTWQVNVTYQSATLHGSATATIDIE
ncbi:MAG: hypothetical protein WBP26_05810 [Candidatus Saccharimonadales bacterium]